MNTTRRRRVSVDLFMSSSFGLKLDEMEPKNVFQSHE